jgi:hypothetical protein
MIRRARQRTARRRLQWLVGRRARPRLTPPCAELLSTDEIILWICRETHRLSSAFRQVTGKFIARTARLQHADNVRCVVIVLGGRNAVGDQVWNHSDRIPPSENLFHHPDVRPGLPLCLSHDDRFAAQRPAVQPRRPRRDEV